MNTDMSREARQWMAALDDVLDTSSAQMLVNPKKWWRWAKKRSVLHRNSCSSSHTD